MAVLIRLLLVASCWSRRLRGLRGPMAKKNFAPMQAYGTLRQAQQAACWAGFYWLALLWCRAAPHTCRHRSSRVQARSAFTGLPLGAACSGAQQRQDDECRLHSAPWQGKRLVWRLEGPRQRPLAAGQRALPPANLAALARDLPPAPLPHLTPAHYRRGLNVEGMKKGGAGRDERPASHPIAPPLGSREGAQGGTASGGCLASRLAARLQLRLIESLAR